MNFDSVNTKLVKFGAAALGLNGLMIAGYLKYRARLIKVSAKDIILITGCDSGIGYNIALRCHSYGMTVLAGCLDPNSNGAQSLRKLSGNIHITEIDLLQPKTIKDAVQHLRDLKSQDSDNKFFGLVNNAGVMCMAEFEWQTETMIEKQVNINLLGTMKLTKAFLPYLRQDHGRLVTISSHCAIQCLPTMSTYGATKAGLQHWMDGLRMEMKQYGVKVVEFIPGSHVFTTNLTADHKNYVNEMKSAFSPEQRQFYERYFDGYNKYVMGFSFEKPLAPIEGRDFDRNIERTILAENPKSIYCNQPVRYAIYHFLFKISPDWLRYYFVSKFVSLPNYKSVMETN